MPEKRKRNIIICSLCTVLLFMALGYAAFTAQLNINGTTSIAGNWNVKITSVQKKESTAGASNLSDPKYDDLTASFSAVLTSPGDYITYDITVTNDGNIDAELADIKVSRNTNPAIVFETSGIDKGSIVEKNGGTANLIVKITYSDKITSQPDVTNANLKVTLDYTQQGKTDGYVPNNKIKVGGNEVELVTDGDGLYEDSTEPFRYIYKGGSPNNYITFNGEEWRIIAIEADGTIKIMKNASIEKRAFDANGVRINGYCSLSDVPGHGCNVWAKNTDFARADVRYHGRVEQDSELKTYLNTTYYNSLKANKTAIENHPFYYGSVTWENDDIDKQVSEEHNASTLSNIGLIQSSDHIKSNADTSSCGTFRQIRTHFNNCKSTTWMIQSNWYYTLSPDGNSSNYLLIVDSNSNVSYADASRNDASIVPALYLKSDTELSGTGMRGSPYTITNYKD